MIPIAIKLFLGGVFKRLSGLLGIIGRYPWQTACIALIALSALLYRGKQSALAERDAARAETAQVITAGEQALAAQIKLHDETKAAYAAAAKDADNEHEIELAAANTAADRYATNNGLRKVCRSGADQTSSGAKNPDTGISESPASEAFVVVSRVDFDKCTALYPYALSSHLWAKSLSDYHDLHDTHSGPPQPAVPQ